MIHVSTAEKNFAENTFFVSTFLDKYKASVIYSFRMIRHYELKKRPV